MSTYTETTTTTDITTTMLITPVPPDSPATLTPLKPTSKTFRTSLTHLLHQALSLLVLLISLLFILSLICHLFSFYTALFLLPPSSTFVLLFYGSIAYATFTIVVLVGDDLLKEVLGAHGVQYGGMVGEVVITWALWVNMVVLVVVAVWVAGWRVVQDWKGWGIGDDGWWGVMEIALGVVKKGFVLGR